MRVLLDTHALVWWWTGSKRLPAFAQAVIADQSTITLVSAATVWEIAIKHRSGKWPDSAVLLERLDERLARSRFTGLPISVAHALAAGALDSVHSDPFDRMLIAQARLEDLTVVTADAVFSAHSVPVVWGEPTTR